MPRRLVKDESGLALALAIMMVVLINCTNLKPPEGYSHPKVRFSATVGQEPEVELALV